MEMEVSRTDRLSGRNKKGRCQARCSFRNGLFDLSGIEYLEIKRDRVFYEKMSEGQWRDVLGWDHEGCEVKASYDYFSQVGRLAFRGCDSSE